MPFVELPEGARRVDARGRYTAGPGDKVRVSPGNIAAVDKFRRTGPTHGQAYTLGTRVGRWCQPCARLWNSWSTSCPRCDTPTSEA